MQKIQHSFRNFDLKFQYFSPQLLNMDDFHFIDCKQSNLHSIRRSRMFWGNRQNEKKTLPLVSFLSGAQCCVSIENSDYDVILVHIFFVRLFRSARYPPNLFTFYIMLINSISANFSRLSFLLIFSVSFLFSFVFFFLSHRTLSIFRFGSFELLCFRRMFLDMVVAITVILRILLKIVLFRNLSATVVASFHNIYTVIPNAYYLGHLMCVL